MARTEQVHSFLAKILKRCKCKRDDFQRYRLERLMRKSQRTDKKKQSKLDSWIEGKCQNVVRAERWISLAIMMRKDSTTEPRKRFHAIKKWKRALKLTSPSSSLTVPTYYRAFIRANLYFDQRKWKEAETSFEACLMDCRWWKTNGYIEWLSSVSTSLRRYCQHMAKDTILTNGTTNGGSLDVVMKKLSSENPAMLELYGRIEKQARILSHLLEELAFNGSRENWDIRSYVFGHKVAFANKLYKVKRSSWLLARTINDSFVEASTDLIFLGESRRFCQCLYHLGHIFKVTRQIIKRKLDSIPEMPEVVEDLEEVSSFNLTLNPGAIWREVLKPQLECILQAYKYLDEKGYEVSSNGLQPLLKPTTYLETKNQELLFSDPYRRCFFNPRNFKEIIPAKPFFYDLAYDLLQSPPNNNTN